MNKEELQEIKNEVAAAFGLEPDSLFDKNRQKPYPLARYAVFWRMKSLGLCPSEIARILGTSPQLVQSGLLRFEDFLDTKDRRCLAAVQLQHPKL